MNLGRLIVFLVVVLGVTAGLHGYLWLRLVRDASWPSPWNRVGAIVLIALWVLLLATFFLMRPLSRAALAPMAWISFTWLGVIAVLMIFLLPAELARAFAWIAGKVQGGDMLEPGRRVLLARSLSAVAGVGSLALTAYGVREALKPVTHKRVSLSVRRLPAGLSGLRIVQLTDVHVGPMIGKGFVEQLVERANALKPDVIAITGDLVDGSVKELGEHVAPLAKLKARHGVYFVTGNHEYYSGVDEWLAFLSSLGIRVLRNERVRLEHEGAAFDLAGVDDYSAHQFGNGHGADLPRALGGREQGVPLVLLAHQPKHAEEAAKLGADVQISGHTHAGQLFPFSLFVRLDTPYVSGEYRVGKMALYVSQGTGYWGPPMRLGTTAELTEIVLGPGDG